MKTRNLNYLRLRPRFPHRQQSEQETQIIIKSRSSIELKSNHSELIFTDIFDHSDNKLSSQQEIFKAVAPQILGRLRSNQNCTVISYGGTACGKTYTIFGTDEQQGIIFGIIREFFQSQKEINIYAQGFQIYNQNIFDLSSSLKSQRMKSQEKISKIRIQTFQDFAVFVKNCLKKRQKLNTSMNNLSGRSTIEIVIHIGQNQLVFIDLPGHQRIVNCSNEIKNQIISINKSLSSFQSVMQSIRLNKEFIPYRDSLITKVNIKRLKQSCVFFMAHVNPFQKQAVSTLSNIKKIVG